MQKYLCIGIILKPHGVRGDVKVQPITDDPARFGSLKQIYFQKGGEYVGCKVTMSRLGGNFAYLHVAGYDSVEAAESLRNEHIYVDRANAVALPEGRYFVADLVGCKVFDTLGNELGELYDILFNGSADVYCVRGPRSFMIPALKTLLHEVNVQEGRIILDAQRLSEVAVYED